MINIVSCEMKLQRSGVALVTTAWLASREHGSRHMDVLSAFLLYHASIGVDRIFIFFDGGVDAQPRVHDLHKDAQELVRSGRVEFYYTQDSECVVSLSGNVLRYAACSNIRGGVAGADVAARQMQHAELAMLRCEQLNAQSAVESHYADADADAGTSLRSAAVEWLLHLDIDELFYLEGFASAGEGVATRGHLLREYVTMLERAGVDQYAIVNYEAVPTTLYGDNYFASATHFRRHTARIPFFATKAQALVAKWQRRSTHQQFFLFYDNGKSIVRVPRASESRHVVPASVHHWRCLDAAPRDWRTASNFFDARRTAHEHDVVPEADVALRSCVLHYPVCGLEWLSEKYKRLGAFSAVWGATSIPIAPCFHLQARDASAVKDEAARRKTLEQLYRSHVMAKLDDAAIDWSAQIATGVCEEITFPSKLLARLGLVDRTSTMIADRAQTECKCTGEDTTLDTKQPGPPLPASPAPLSMEKAWMLAAITDKYL